MNKLIEKIEAEKITPRSHVFLQDSEYNGGLQRAIDILRSTPGLWLEEISEEEAVEARNASKYVMGFESDGCGPYDLDFRDSKGFWHIYYDSGAIEMAKFYRLPQAKEEK